MKKNFFSTLYRTSIKETIILSLLILGIYIGPCESRKNPRRLGHYPISCDLSMNEVDNLLMSGSVQGYLTYSEFWAYWEQLRKSYPTYFSKKIQIGNSWERRPMWGFYFGENVHEGQKYHAERNIVFITALHHAREPLTVTMVLFMMISILRERGVCGQAESDTALKWKLFFRNNIFFFIPFVNPDSYLFIEQYYNNPNTELRDKAMMVRKNRNVDESCSKFTGGVDLNRNYSFKFALDEKGSSSNPCEEDYRGVHPFSEPETQAVRNFVSSHKNIVSGINMHTYGNAWVYPYNFVHDAHNDLLHQEKPHFYNFYQEFVREMKHKHIQGEFGNAQKTVQYPTNGEAGDWITEVHNVLNLDVELGTPNTETDKFYPKRHLIPTICRYNFRVFREFFWKHNVNLELFEVRRNKRNKTLTFVLFNKSISSISQFSATISAVMRKPLKHRQYQRKLRSNHHSKSKKRKHNRKLKRRRNHKKRKREHSWHKLNFNKMTKTIKTRVKRKKPRLLSTNDYEVYYKMLNFCCSGHDSTGQSVLASHLKKAHHNLVTGKMLGRHYLVIRLQFDSLFDMDKVDSLDLQINYGNGYIKTYQYNPSTSKRKVLMQRVLESSPHLKNKQGLI